MKLYIEKRGLEGYLIHNGDLPYDTPNNHYELVQVFIDYFLYEPELFINPPSLVGIEDEIRVLVKHVRLMCLEELANT